MLAILAAGAIALAVSLLGTPVAIQILRQHGMGQLIQADLPDSHKVKRGTPTMGGIVIIVATTIAYVAVHLIVPDVGFSKRGILVIATMISLGAVGLLDDGLKLRNQRSLGLTKSAKVAGQAVCAIGLGLAAWYWAHLNPEISFARPIPGTSLPMLGFLLWVFLIVAATSNGVNLTDGMDGLASGATVVVAGAFAGIAFWQLRHACSLAPHAGCYALSAVGSQDIAAASAALVGAVAGFLWWNAPPARIFMGDTGSLALGGALASLALVTQTQLLLIVLGGLYVVETVSVILQVASFRLLHRRVFKMAPIHLHFELSGWPEVTVIVRFWMLAGIAVAIGSGLFYAQYLLAGGVRG